MRIALSVFVCLCSVLTCAVILEDFNENLEYSESEGDFSSVFRQCVMRMGAMLPCVSKGALAGLVRANDHDVVNVAEGVVLLRDATDQSPRSLIPVDRDPTDLRSVLDASSEFFSRRSLRWDLSSMYPGLVLKVGPSLGGSGVLEFFMDQRLHHIKDRQAGTGRLVFRQFILPILLGVKVKLIALIPIFFGLLVMISKKALLFSKMALLVSSFLGFNSMFLLQQPDTHGPALDTNVPLYDPLGLHGGAGFRGVNYHHQEDAAKRGLRNFAWEEEQRD